MLDTNICVHALRGHRSVLARLHAAGRNRLLLNKVVLAELLQGVEASAPAHRARNASQVAAFVAALPVHPWCEAGARSFGQLRPQLRSAGRMIGELDLMIAAQALARGWTVATENVRAFDRIPGLVVENWAA